MATEAASAWQDHKQQGNALYTAGKTAEAVDAYTKALQCDDLPPPDRATILCNRAQCFLKLNDNAKAAEDCTACLTLSPDNVKALFRRAAALEALGDLADALRDYRDVARVSPSVADAGAGVRRLEAKLGIAPTAVVPADDGRLEVTDEEMRGLQEVTLRLKDVKRQRAKAAAQLAATQRERKQVSITQATLAQLPAGTRSFRAVGRMFLHTPGAEMDTLLADRLAKADTRERVCEGTIGYLARQEADAEAAYGEMIRGLKAKRGMA